MHWLKKAAASVMAALICLPVFASSSLSPEEAYESARKDYLCAWMSMAAYDDPISLLGREILENEHWKLSGAAVTDKPGHARFLLARSGDKEKKQLLILSVAGTTDYTDVKADLSVDKTPWDPSSSSDGKGNEIPRVHRGFKRYTDSIWDTRINDTPVSGILKEETEKGEVILTGHSLGGAVSTLLGAKMLDSGIDRHFEVVTFGAPSTGNHAFTDSYEDRLPLKRIVNKGDPAESAVQKIIRNYTQMGQEERWVPASGDHYFSHRMIVYLDTAIRNYYDARDEYVKSKGTLPEEVPSSPPSLYVLPMKISADEKLSSDLPYIDKITGDYYRKQIPGSVIGTEEERTSNPLTLARQKGCSHILERELTTRYLPEKNKELLMTLIQTLRTAEGRVVSYSEYTMPAKEMTPIEAALYMTARNKPQI